MIETTDIPGLLLVRIPVHDDVRGWFKENWQRERMTRAGLPDFGPVQHNISYNFRAGTTRGIHAEPWDKFVSIAAGRAFGAWVDLRAGDNFGTVVTAELDPSMAVFVPRGVGNAFQTLQDDTAYTYLVSQHWNPESRYAALDLADETVAIQWPIPLSKAVISDKDRAQPRLEDVTPMLGRRVLITGGGGQLATALADLLPDAVVVSERELDIADQAAVDAWPWSEHDIILNAAAWTDVDGAETPEGRRRAWQVNTEAPAHLARVATDNHLALVHYSTDYVFDGSLETHPEDEAISPLGVYGQTKAAGDLAVSATPRHYVLRTSWLVGSGHNFVRTMKGLAERGIRPAVVDDQFGRLTFTDELARATVHLLRSRAAYGTYNLTGDGPVSSWADVARAVFELCGRDATEVRPVSTEEYLADKHAAPRPRHSTLSLDRIRATGFRPTDWRDALRTYVAGL